MADETVLLGHGSGGTMMKRIIDDVFAATYGSEELAQGNDAALLPAPAPGERQVIHLPRPLKVLGLQA